jgi:membrane protein DedA with SNARE-associated domain
LQKYGRYLHLPEPRVSRIEGWLARYGGFAVFAGRLIPGMRCGSSFVAGTFGIPYGTFLIATAASATVWWGFFLYLGSQLGRWVVPVVEQHPYTLLFFGGFVLLSALVPAYVRYRMGQEGTPAGALKLSEK